jgi:tRNA dimethylallyltransferase
MRLAERHGLAIVSADSRQIYRGFDVGTAKPTDDERRRVPHFGIDVAAPEERYSAARWAESFDEWAAGARALGRAPLVVGGTGLYLRALAAPLFDEPPMDVSRRSALATFLEELPQDALRRWVTALDPERARLGRTQLLRAAEVALLTGHRVSALHTHAARAPRHAMRYLVVDPGRDVLRERVTARTDAMLDAGWVDEVRALVRTVPADAAAWNSTGYEWLRRHVLGEISLADARARIVIETRQYAKRQRTWFRHQLRGADVVWLDPLTPDAEEQADAWWRGQRGFNA